MSSADILVLAAAAPAAAVIAWVDATRFEIEFEALIPLAATTLAWSALVGPDELIATGAGAALGAFWFWIVRVWRPARIGAGDVWLAGAAGGVAGVFWLPWLIGATLAAALAVSAGYGLARGLPARGRLFSSIPMALALAPAMIACLVLRILHPGGWP